MKNNSYFVSVDVGSFSVRAAVFDREGIKHSYCKEPIEVYDSGGGIVEQSSDNIWQNTCKAIRNAVRESGVKIQSIKGIAFDATCSLVVLGSDDKPLSVSITGDNNIIMWMDHRALREAEYINQTNDAVLKYVGGKISPEMQLPKILWLKNNSPGTYAQARKFFDLADYLVYKASGKDIRSVCTQACKWTYLAHDKCWSNGFLKKIDLYDIFDHNRVGNNIEDLGKPAGLIDPVIAHELGLSKNTIVAVGVIDAHAGGIGLLGSAFENTIAIIAGTSFCHMAVSKTPVFTQGVWGPYYGAMIPKMWLNEGGQSAAGSLIDHIIQDNPYSEKLYREAETTVSTVYTLLNNEVEKIEEREGCFTRDFHLLGYFHGNRSPRADPQLKGMISGLTLDRNRRALAQRYLAAIQSIAYGTRHIIEVMNQSGHKISKISMCGGGIENSLLLRELADITGSVISIPSEPEAVLLGCAILAAAACDEFPNVPEAMAAMSSVSHTIKPRVDCKEFHEKKYRIFHEMYKDQLKYNNIMQNEES